MPLTEFDNGLQVFHDFEDNALNRLKTTANRAYIVCKEDYPMSVMHCNLL